MQKKTVWILAIAILLSACSGPWNDPHSPDSGEEIIYQTNFQLPPKTLDPAVSFSSDESMFLAQIYEPPLGYHFLKRPYELEPVTAQSLPEIQYLDNNFQTVPKGDPNIAYSRYSIDIKKDLKYQPHPAFVTKEGKHHYFFTTEQEGSPYTALADFQQSSTREVKADDFIYQIKRLADPHNSSPMMGFMGDYIVGMSDLTETLRKIDQEQWIDLREYNIKGVEKINDYRYAITINGVYPQFSYWLAMTFFVPMPWEADRFFKNPGFKEKNLTLAWYPVGTGPFMMTVNDPNRQIILERNPNFRDDFYPTEGEASDADNGFLADAGKKLPFIDKAIYTLDKSTLPMWTKFLQGYYDRSGENHGNVTQQFDQALAIGPNGIELSEEMQGKNISLSEDVKPAIYYYGFNMLDPVVGGYSIEKQKLRQAIAIAYNIEEYIDIFRNGSALPYMNPIPPGIDGHPSGKAGINPYTHDWLNGEPVRKDIEYAKQLMAEAGYPGGRDAKTGKPLKLYFDEQSQATSKNLQDWQKRQLEPLGIQIEFRASDWNRYKQKIRDGNVQIYTYGWLADYPDPENFLFMLHRDQSPVITQSSGVNASNYDNPEYNRLFDQMKTMDPGPERAKIVADMVNLLQEDSPWFTGYYSKDYYLNNEWVYNGKRHGITKATLKYLRIDDETRKERQLEWNKPNILPLVASVGGFILLFIPAVRAYRRRQKLTITTDKE